MRLRKLELKGFGRFQSLILTLDAGLNVIHGSNEAGKTTIQSFIKGMLFNLKGGRRTKDGSLLPVKQYRPWDGNQYGGIMEYELDDGRQFTVIRNFLKNTLTVLDEFSNDITGEFPSGKDEGARFAEQHLGLSEGGFERTSFIGQMQSFVDAEGRKILAERLQNLRQSGDEELSVRKAMKVLKDAQLSRIGSDRTTIRPLNLLESRLSDALSEEQEYIKLHESSMDIFVELDQLQKEEARLKKELEQVLAKKEAVAAWYKAVERNSLYQKLLVYHQQLTELSNEYEGNEKEMAALQKRLGELDAYKGFSQNVSSGLTSDFLRYQLTERELEDLHAHIATNNDKLARIQQQLAQCSVFDREGEKIESVLKNILEPKTGTGMEKSEALRQAGHKERKKLRRTVTGIFLVSLVTLAYALVFRGLLPEYAEALLAAAAGVFLAILAERAYLQGTRISRLKPDFYSGRKQEETENQELLLGWFNEAGVDNLQDFIRLKALYHSNRQLAEELEKENRDLEQKESQAADRMNEISAGISGLLRSVHILEDSKDFTGEDIQIFKDNLEEYCSLLPAMKDAQGRSASVLQRKEGILREIALLCGETSATLVELERIIEEIRLQSDAEMPKKPEEDMDSLTARIQAYQERQQQIQLRMNTLMTRLEGIPDTEALQQAHERVQRLTHEKEKLIFFGKALDIATQALSEAGVIIQRDYVPSLNREMSGILRSITDGKYGGLKADDSLALKLESCESTDMVFPEQLSSGTSDQIYFALRLAAVRMVEQRGERLPLFLDEPFAQYDEMRTGNALELLLEESRARQILLFTCKKREVEMLLELAGEIPVYVIELDR